MEVSGACMQDTLETSLCANRLFPTARLSCIQAPDTSLQATRAVYELLVPGNDIRAFTSRFFVNSFAGFPVLREAVFFQVCRFQRRAGFCQVGCRKDSLDRHSALRANKHSGFTDFSY